MWAGPEGAGSYPTGAGEPWKGFTQGCDIVIRSNLGTKQRRNTVEMKQRLKRSAEHLNRHLLKVHYRGHTANENMFNIKCH